MKYKLVATDLDGTLLNSASKITTENKEILQDFMKKGGKLVVATGRTYFSTKPILDELGIENGFVIVYNGAKIINLGDNSTFFHSTLTEEALPILTEISRVEGIHLNLYQDDEWFVEDKSNSRALEYAIHCGKEPMEENFDNILSLPMTKALFIGKRDELDRIYSHLYEKLKDLVHFCFSSDKYLEVLPLGINKGSALEKVINHYNIERDLCVAFGDEMNDLEMLLSIKNGVAMGNANVLLKEKVSLVTKSNDESGIYHFLKDKI